MQNTDIARYVEDKIRSGAWRQETLPADVVGLSRPITVARAHRKDNLIVWKWHGDHETFCPPMWWDLAIGSGPCGFGCRSCYLLLTFRAMRDPMRHLLYDNINDYTRAGERWLLAPERRSQHTLGLGIDRSDSLLYEGVIDHIHNLAPLFGNPTANPRGCKLILLTKSANTHLLQDIAPADRANVIVTFSLNPEPIANLWEGLWPDTGERITPPIQRRLEAALLAQQLSFEVRARIDPILTPDSWQDCYADFIAQVRGMGIEFRYWTLGTYREKNAQLDHWRAAWGLPAMEWEPSDLAQDGTHRHLPTERRVEIYRAVADAIRREFPQAAISLCKETHAVRKEVGLCNAWCNCLR